MKHIIQENIWNERSYSILIDSIKRMGLKYDIVKHRPFTHDIVTLNHKPYSTTDKNVFVWGGTGMAKTASKLGWIPGSLLNDNHNFEVYSKHYGKNMFNSDSIILNFEMCDFSMLPNLFFARPTLDNKSFTGKVFSKDEFINLHTQFKANKWNTNFNIQIATPKNIQKEFRFWVVGDKVVTGSLYRYGQNVFYDNVIDDDAFDFAQNMINIYKPAQAFVIDIVMANNEYSIMELGCINSAGFYKANIPLLLYKLEEFFNSIYNNFL